MTVERLFPTLCLTMFACASAIYAWQRNYPRALYWFFDFCITFTIQFLIGGGK